MLFWRCQSNGGCDKSPTVFYNNVFSVLSSKKAFMVLVKKEPMETLPRGICQPILIFFGDLIGMVVVIKAPIPAVYCSQSWHQTAHCPTCNCPSCTSIDVDIIILLIRWLSYKQLGPSHPSAVGSERTLRMTQKWLTHIRTYEHVPSNLPFRCLDSHVPLPTAPNSGSYFLDFPW